MEHIAMKTWVFAFIAVRLFMDGAEEFFILPTAWYYIQSLGQTKTFLGIVLSAYSISAVLSGPVIGKLADRFGHIKFIIICCYFLKLGGNLLYSMSFSEYFPLFGRFVSGLADGSAGVLYGQVALLTQPRHRAKMFVFLDGMYALGTSFGPTVSSFLTFEANILGWRIDAGNSPGLVLTVIWSTSMIFALFLPDEFAHYDEASKIEVFLETDHTDHMIPQSSEQPTKLIPFDTRVLCLFYLIFLSLFYSATVTFYTPLMANEHIHVQFIHIKLLFLTSSMFAFALILSLYIAAEYFDERKLLAFLMFIQLVPIGILTYFAFYWGVHSVNEAYILIAYICLGMPYFSFAFGCSLMSKITDPNDATFYQGSCYATLHFAFVTSRTISGFMFTHTLLPFYCLVLLLSWLAGVFWFCAEYRKLGFLRPKTYR